MTDAAQHIFNWANNDATSYKRMLQIAQPGNYFITSAGRFSAAANLAADTLRKMRRCNESNIGTYDEMDMAYATILFLEFRAE